MLMVWNIMTWVYLISSNIWTKQWGNISYQTELKGIKRYEISIANKLLSNKLS